MGLLALVLGLTCFTNQKSTAGTVLVLIGCVLILPALARLKERKSSQQTPNALNDAARADLELIADKFHMMLFLGREDGALRARERDLIVAYLRAQPGAEDATDAWLSEMHRKLPRESLESVAASVGRLKQASCVDSDLINTSEALVHLTKAPTAGQLRVLVALRGSPR